MRNFMKNNKGLTIWGLMIILVIVAIFGIAFYKDATAANGTFTTQKHWKQKWERFSATAAETIALGDAIAINRYNGKAYKGDIDDVDRRPIVGLAGNAATSGNKVEIVRKGIIAGMPCGLTAQLSSQVTPIGTPLFAATNQGGVTIFTGCPTTGVSQFVGFAMPLSEQATESGVTTGTDTYLIDVLAGYMYKGGVTIF